MSDIRNRIQVLRHYVGGDFCLSEPVMVTGPDGEPVTLSHSKHLLMLDRHLSDEDEAAVLDALEANESYLMGVAADTERVLDLALDHDRDVGEIRRIADMVMPGTSLPADKGLGVKVLRDRLASREA